MFKQLRKFIARKKLVRIEKEIVSYEEISKEQLLQVNPEFINDLYISAAVEVLELQKDLKNHPIITRIKAIAEPQISLLNKDSYVSLM